MKSIILLFGLSFILFSCNQKADKNSKNDNGLVAENLWGKKIPIENIIRKDKPTVVVPFSTSHCGYCLIDGYYSEKNYIENNTNFGGNSFHMCLFNPQLDIYTFEKHFGWKSDILTFPIELYKYHEDGFPTVLAFKNGKQIFQEFYDYAQFDSLSSKLWNNKMNLVPTGEMHIAKLFIYENKINASVMVYPQKDSIPQSEIASGKKWNSHTCKKINQLTKEDLNKHLLLKGNFSFDELSNFFDKSDCPVKFQNDSVKIGNYSFDYHNTEIQFTCPNPYNNHKYLVVNISNGNKFNELTAYLDYVFYQTKNDTTKKVLYGHFNKADNGIWTFSEQKSFSELNKQQYCKGHCEMPRNKHYKNSEKGNIVVSVKKKKDLTEYTFGKDFCKFPDITSDNEGNIWTVWEENGDINLSRIDLNGKTQTYKIEQNESDSYNPKITVSNNKIWIFYLNNKDGYYRLYYKTFDGLRLSDEILLSRKRPYDVVLPSVASNGDELTISYSIWLANYRLLVYTKIKNNIKSEIEYVNVCAPIYLGYNYINAWYPSICYDNNGEVWGAWNQHYPSNFGVCGGKLNEQAQPITQSAEKMEDWEEGGYPKLFMNDNNKYVVWQSSDIWGLYQNKITQNIKFSKFDDKQKKWSIGEIISLPTQTFLNETPDAITDKDKNIWVVYSGRKKGNNTNWGVYLTHFSGANWTKPILISGKNENARAPKITIGKNNNLWITWHSGIGKKMKIKVLKTNTNANIIYTP